MSEATLVERREVAAELREEVLEKLDAILGTCRSAMKLGTVELILEEHPPDASGEITSEVLKVAPFVRAFDRLAWLLGLSDAERAFVDDAATAALGQPGEAYAPLMVFADWLEDRLRDADAGEIRRLVPQTGDVVTITMSDDVFSAAQQVNEWPTFIGRIDAKLSRLGREVLIVPLPRTIDLEIPDNQWMRDHGWVRHEDAIREHHDALTQIGQEIAAEPEATKGRLITENALDVIRRLKRENSELKSGATVNVAMAALAQRRRDAARDEREACAVEAENALSDFGTDDPREALRAAAAAIRARP